MTTTSLQPINFSLPMGSLDAYIERVNQMPMLTLEEENDLAKRFYEQNDLTAARQLVMAHMRFVVRVARGYLGYGLPYADLIQEGTVGLMKAVKRFNPSMGVRLVSFAVHWIKAEIHEFILRNWRIVKVATTKAQRKLFFNLRSAKKRLGWFTKEEVAAVANDLGVSEATVTEMESRLNAQDMAFDVAPDEEADDHHHAPVYYLEDHKADPARMLEADDSDEHEHQTLQAALEKLDDRSRDIVHRRWLATKKATLHQLADLYKVSAERIRQLENNAMKKLRELI